MSKTILRLTLHRIHFARIAQGKKRVEYRKRTKYWMARLEGKTFDLIQFRNGYSSCVPVMLVEFRGLRRYGKGRGAYYAISLGRVLSVKRWKPLPR